MTEQQVEDRLRRDLTLAAETLVTSDAPVPPFSAHYLEPAPVPSRPRRRRPQVAWAGTVAIAVLVALFLATSGRSATRVTRSAGAPTSPGSALPRLLPPPDFTIEAGTEWPPPPSGAEQDPTYVQAFEGVDDVDPPRLLVATVIASPDAIDQYRGGPDAAQVTDVHGREAYLLSFKGHAQMLWQDADGLVVSLEASHLEIADLRRIADGISRRTVAEQGVDLTTTLALQPVGEGRARNAESGDELMVTFSQGDCHGYVQVFRGGQQDLEAVGILAGSSRVISINGHRSTLVTFPGAGDLTTMTWIARRGVAVRVQGQDCDVVALAGALREVDERTWRKAAPNDPLMGRPTPPPPPSFGAFGLAH